VRARLGPRLAWSTFAAGVVLIAGTFVLESLNHRLSGHDAANGYSAVVVVLTFAGVGALVASRQPANPLGWIFCGIGVLQALNMFGDGYARYAVVTHPGALPGGEVLAWLKEWCWIPSLVALPFLLLLFPDGHLPSPRWRRAAWATGGAGAVVVAIAAVGLWPERGRIALGRTSDGDIAPLPAAVVIVATAVILLGTVASVVALVLRFRRSRGVERLQLKWFALAGTFMAACVGSAFLPAGVVPEELTDVGLLAVPLATGVAILRYRLYDIDVVINRTLVYGALTATLAVTYLACVLLLQLVLQPVTADSGLAIAASTLAVAALFGPARARIQRAVDRRFYRRRYDAQRTLEAFSAQLRDQVDLDAVSRELRAVVGETVQPRHVSMWLRRDR
jgi:hypothetical protein